MHSRPPINLGFWQFGRTELVNEPWLDLVDVCLHLNSVSLLILRRHLFDLFLAEIKNDLLRFFYCWPSQNCNIVLLELVRQLKNVPSFLITMMRKVWVQFLNVCLPDCGVSLSSRTYIKHEIILFIIFFWIFKGRQFLLSLLNARSIFHSMAHHTRKIFVSLNKCRPFHKV